MLGGKGRFQPPLTVREVVSKINERKYLLPGIQREFVWRADRIVKLFDSLMRNYPIGSFLFWDLRKEKMSDFQFYEFLRNFHDRDRKHNPKANIVGEDDLTIVLDGQQRLTSLYIGLKGTYAEKIPWKRWDSNEAFPEKKLFLNLSSKPDQSDEDQLGLLYDFRFLSEHELSEDHKGCWFEIGKILDFSGLGDLTKYVSENHLEGNELAVKCLEKLYEVINKEDVINFYLETSQDLDKVLQIFIRVNSAGEPLSYSDLLLSIATAQWKTRDARDEIIKYVDEISRIGEGFFFSKDFVMKSCLILCDVRDIGFRVENFNLSNMSKIESKWDFVTKAIRLAVRLVSSFGYNYRTLTSNNAIIPIAYYIAKTGNPDNFAQSSDYQDDRQKIRKWLAVTLLKGTFGGQSDNVLRQIREVLQQSKTGFPYDGVVEKFKGTNKSMMFTDDDIEGLLLSKYGHSLTFSALSLLYPQLNFNYIFHQDHIHPKKFFGKTELRRKSISEDRREFYQENCDSLPNLQLLEGTQNEEKSSKDFASWLDETCPNDDDKREYLKRNLVPPGVDLGFNNFEEFFNKRGQLIIQQLKRILT